MYIKSFHYIKNIYIYISKLGKMSAWGPFFLAPKLGQTFLEVSFGQILTFLLPENPKGKHTWQTKHKNENKYKRKYKYTLHYITLHHITLHYIYIALHCIAIHCMELHHITLQYSTLHYTTQHNIHAYTNYMHTYIHTYIHAYVRTYKQTDIH